MRNVQCPSRQKRGHVTWAALVCYWPEKGTRDWDSIRLPTRLKQVHALCTVLGEVQCCCAKHDFAVCPWLWSFRYEMVLEPRNLG